MMKSERMPFAANSSAVLYRAESLWDHVVVRWRGYVRASGPLWYTLSPSLWEWWYDPASLERDT